MKHKIADRAFFSIREKRRNYDRQHALDELTERMRPKILRQYEENGLTITEYEGR